MREVVFLDTSVLLNIFDVPGKNGHRSSVLATLTDWQGRGAVFALPVTALIETGNHIAQLPDGRLRRRHAETFLAAVRLALSDEPAWVVSGEVWDRELVASILDGGTSRPDAVSMVGQGVGIGDIGILAERDAYRRRIPSGTPVHIWSLDAGLNAYAGVG